MPHHINPAARHLFEWFTEPRKKIISLRALDMLAKRPLGTLSRFMACQPGFTFIRADLAPYYPFLALVGYLPDLEH